MRVESKAMINQDSLENLRNRINTFVTERDWAQFHTPKNLAMAMIVEADRKSTRLNSSHQ